jgi:hypothetical protein
MVMGSNTRVLKWILLGSVLIVGLAAPLLI